MDDIFSPISRGPAQERKLAVLIGIDRYQGGIRPLGNAVRDIHAVADVLRELHGYEVRCIEDEQATLPRLRQLLHDLRSELTPDHRVVFYFAGHGISAELHKDTNTVTDGPQGFLVPQDARAMESDSLWPMEDLQRGLKELRCRHLLVLLDCCFAGAFRWARTRSVEVSWHTLYRERYERYLRDPSRQVITSTMHDERAMDTVGSVFGTRGEEENSPFARALCQGLRGAADLRINGEPGDGVIAASELEQYIEHALSKLQTQLGKPLQRPMLWSLQGYETGHFMFWTPGHEPNLPRALELTEANNPYRGLAPYDEEHQHLLFGRQEVIRDLCIKVQQQPLTVVVGASGTGKSSVVRAGVMPSLRKQAAPSWHILSPIRLCNAPLSTLSELSGQLGRAGQPLPAALAAWRRENPQRQMLLVIDQAEELITVSSAEKGPFLQALDAVRQAGGEQLHIVMTLRSDFETHFEFLLKEKSGVQSPRFRLLPMKREELRQAIEEPAVERVLFFDPPKLVETLTNEVVDEPGALPLLSFTLSEMYRAYVLSQRQNRTLSEDDYNELGGVSGALSQRAQEIFSKLGEKEQRTLRNLMLRMVVPGELTRRRVMMHELQFADAAEQDRVNRVVRELLDARLLVSDSDSAGQAYVEPAHDKLVMGWPHLRTMLDQERELFPLLHSLAYAVSEWNSRQASWLIWSHDPRLPQLRAALHRAPRIFNRQEDRFIRRSFRVRLGIWGSLGLAVVAAIIVLLYQRSIAEQNAKEAKQKADEAHDGLLVAMAQALGDDPTTAAMLLREANPRDSILWTQSASDALRTGVARDVLRAHEEIVTSAAFSPDGKKIVTGSQDGTARVWNADGSGTPVVLRGHEIDVSSVAFSPDGTRIVTGSGDRTARVWNADGFGTPVVLRGHDANILSVAFSPHGKKIATGSIDGTIRIWNADGSGTPLVFDGHASWVTSVAFSPDGQKIATASGDETARIWNADGSGTPLVLTGHSNYVSSVAFSPNGKKIVTGSWDQTVRIWNADGSGDPLVLRGHANAVSSVAFSPDGSKIATGSRSVGIWNADGSGVPRELQGHGNMVFAVAFSSDGKKIVTGHWDHTARIWDADGPSSPLVFKGHSDRISSVTFSPDGKQIATGSWDKTARIWNSDGSGERLLLKGYEAEVRSIAFSPDGKLIITGLENGTARLWNADGSGTPLVFKGLGGAVTSVAFSPDGRKIVTADDATARIWNADGSGTPLMFPGHRNTIFAVAFSPDGKKLAIGNGDNTALIWNLVGSSPPLTLKGHDEAVTSVAFSPDGEKIVTGSWDRTARIWNTDGSSTPSVLRGHEGHVYSVAFSPDGRKIATASMDRTVRIWSGDGSGAPLTLIGHQGFVYSVAFSPDGKKVVTGSQDSTARIWIIASDALHSALWDATSDCLPIDRRKALLFESLANATQGYEHCRQEVARRRGWPTEK